MSQTFKDKQNALMKQFAVCETLESKYEKIIELGRSLAPFPSGNKIPENLVKGCQSIMYLYSRLEGDQIFFEVGSDALISAGLAALLINVYNGESPEVVLTSPPDYLKELGVEKSLTPNRANGLYSIYMRMKQDALRLIVEREKGKKKDI